MPTSSVHSFTCWLGTETRKCIALRFINKAEKSFRLLSNIKHRGYKVTGSELKIKLTFKHPSLYHFITFRGKDPTGMATVLLDGDESISVTPQIDCSHAIDVDVTFVTSRCNIILRFFNGGKCCHCATARTVNSNAHFLEKLVVS